MARYSYIPFDYVTPPELCGQPARQAPVAIIGAGPIGLAAAIDLAQHGVASIVLDDNNVVSVGSRAICWAKRTLEIFCRLGVGQRILDKGVTWKVGRLFNGDQQVYSFDLLPEEGHRCPAFINLQQYYVEEYLVDRCRDFPDLIDLRFKNHVVAHEDLGQRVRLSIETPDGPYSLEADWVIACDGARSPTRQRMGLEFGGVLFEERFLIADVEMQADMPSERLFWFNPPFHPGQSALVHKQPDNIYRIDLQLGWDADPEAEKQPERVIPRIRAAVGHDRFDLDWVSVYTFQCRRLERFIHGRVIFAGDSAHIVSPFGARGGNGGMQDVDNLCWKLAAVVQQRAGLDLLETYNEERVHGTDENLLNSSRATNFMTPKGPVEAMFRDEVLRLAGEYEFARRLVNSGRLSVPCTLRGLCALGPGGGDPCPDAPVRLANGVEGWLLDHLGGDWVLLCLMGEPLPSPPGVRVLVMGQDLEDGAGLVAARYPDAPAVLIRPDQHIAAIVHGAEDVTAALRTARVGTLLAHGQDVTPPLSRSLS